MQRKTFVVFIQIKLEAFILNACMYIHCYVQLDNENKLGRCIMIPQKYIKSIQVIVA